MVSKTSEKAEKKEMLISFFDLTNFARMARQKSDEEIYEFLSEFYKRSGEIVEGAGGTIVKFIGDAALAVFTKDLVDEGVKSFLELKQSIDGWSRELELPCRLILKVHYGELVCGMLGSDSVKRFDVIGKEVNTTAILESKGFALSPQAFRKLKKETRQLFKKHTPPIRYIPMDESHKD